MKMENYLNIFTLLPNWTIYVLKMCDSYHFHAGSQFSNECHANRNSIGELFLQCQLQRRYNTWIMFIFYTYMDIFLVNRLNEMCQYYSYCYSSFCSCRPNANMLETFDLSSTFLLIRSRELFLQLLMIFFILFLFHQRNDILH